MVVVILNGEFLHDCACLKRLILFQYIFGPFNKECIADG